MKKRNSIVLGAAVAVIAVASAALLVQTRTGEAAEIEVREEGLVVASAQADDALAAVSARVGFEVKVPWSGGPARLIAEDMPDSGPWPLPQPTEDMIRAARRRTKAAFRRDLVRAAPTGLRYLVRGRKSVHRERLRTLLGLGSERETNLLLDERFLGWRLSAAALWCCSTAMPWSRKAGHRACFARSSMTTRWRALRRCRMMPRSCRCRGSWAG